MDGEGVGINTSDGARHKGPVKGKGALEKETSDKSVLSSTLGVQKK